MKNWRPYNYILLMLAMSTFLVCSTCLWFMTATQEIDRLFYQHDESVFLSHIELNGQKVSDRESMKYLTNAIIRGSKASYTSGPSGKPDAEGFVSNRFVYASIEYFRTGTDEVTLSVSTGGERAYVSFLLGLDTPTPLRELFERNQPPAAVR